MKTKNNLSSLRWLARNASDVTNSILNGGLTLLILFLLLLITKSPSNWEILSDPHRGEVFLISAFFLSLLGGLTVAVCVPIVMRFILKQRVFKVHNSDNYDILEIAYTAIYSKRAKRKILEHMYVVNNAGIVGLLNESKHFSDACYLITRWLMRNYFIETEKNGTKSIENIFLGENEREILHKVVADLFFGGQLLNYDEFKERYTTLMLKMGQQSKLNSTVVSTFNTYIRSFIKPTIEKVLRSEFELFTLLPKDVQVSQINDLYKIIGATRMWEMYDIDAQATYLNLKLNTERLSEMMTHSADVAALKELLNEVCKLN